MPKKPGKRETHSWEFRRFFRAEAYGWNGTARASKRIKSAVREIKVVAKKEPSVAADGAVVFIEKCWRAIEHIDSSSGAIGNAVNNALFELAHVIAHAEMPAHKRLKLTERIWESWQDEDYGYYDVLCELWPTLCVAPEIMSHWADAFLPVVKNVFDSTTPGSYFKGSEPCLACLFKLGRYDEIIEILNKEERMLFDYRQYEIKVVAAQGNIDKALKMISDNLADFNSMYHAARLGEEILLQAGRVEEAYKRYGLMMPFKTTGLATVAAIRKRYPDISPQRILNDLIDADAGNERRYFAAARKIGMIELAMEIADNYDVEPKTLTTACKDYLDNDPNLSLKFGITALQKYADGYGYEPEYADVEKCYDFVCMAAERAGKKDDIIEKIATMAKNDTSMGRLVSAVAQYRHMPNATIVAFRPRS